jgi:hypothetical protein
VTGRPKIAVLGLLTRLPYSGVVWQTLHYLEGFRRLGYDTYYVDAHGSMPLSFFRSDGDDGWQRAADWLGATMRWMGFADRWPTPLSMRLAVDTACRRGSSPRSTATRPPS